jgi:predicted nucleic acid-binding Zn ribbon protein
MRRAASTRGGPIQPVGAVLDQVLAGLKLEERFAAAAATELWIEAVGPKAAARTRAVGVRDGELLVEVKGAVWMGHLALLRHGIQEAINRRLPAEARIRTIRLAPMTVAGGAAAPPGGENSKGREESI